ncbi:MAG: TonB-dependent receptor, partial [Luteitalea sp.]
MRTLLLLLAVVVAGSISSTAYGQAAVTRVRVLDVLGDPVSGASVVVTSGDAVVRVVLTGPDERADVGGPSGLPAGLCVAWLVSAPGFGGVRADAPSSATGEVVVTVRPAARSEDVTVTAGRRAVRGAELPADATVLSRRDLEVTAAGTLDDVLRLTPGFSLFRRSSSRTSNPTTQGVTLRGLSASGASRTLVLADGVPLNDPFGGWVSWNRVPQVAIDRVEVVRGGASDLYGADAAGGVIQLLSVEPVSTVVRALVEGGGQGSGRLSTLVGSRRGSWSGSVSAERTTTDGAIPIAPEVRGPIDTEAGMDSGVVAVHATGTVAGAWRASIRGQVFDEDRKNGTLLQDNDTNQRQASADLAGFGRWGDLRVRAFSAGQGYD